MCPPDRFTCNSGHCIKSSLKCDGINNCQDNSDEENCDNSTCQWNTCSQICIETRQNVSVCKCLPGYTHIKGGTCLADGSLADLVLASEAELRLMSPYKPGDSNKLRSKTLATAPGYKVDGVDILYDKNQPVAFWTDHQNKRIQSMVLNLGDARTKRDIEVVKTVIGNLNDPRGISIDWISKRLYVTDGIRILVTTLEGLYTYTLVIGEMQQPRDIVVSPEEGIMFWADWGPAARIETAHMDGNKRRVLIASAILYPTGLAIDYTTKRLYWADPKTLTVETTRLDGSDRRIVRHFTKGKNSNFTIFNFSIISIFKRNQLLFLLQI